MYLKAQWNGCCCLMKHWHGSKLPIQRGSAFMQGPRRVESKTGGKDYDHLKVARSSGASTHGCRGEHPRTSSSMCPS